MQTCERLNLFNKELPRLIRTLRLMKIRKRSAIKLSTSVFTLMYRSLIRMVQSGLRNE